MSGHKHTDMREEMASTRSTFASSARATDENTLQEFTEYASGVKAIPPLTETRVSDSTGEGGYSKARNPLDPTITGPRYHIDCTPNLSAVGFHWRNTLQMCEAYSKRHSRLAFDVYYVDGDGKRWNGARYLGGELVAGSTEDPREEANRPTILVPPCEFPERITHIIMVRSGPRGPVLAHMFFANKPFATSEFDRLIARGVKNVVLYESPVAGDEAIPVVALVDGALYDAGSKAKLKIDGTFITRGPYSK